MGEEACYLDMLDAEGRLVESPVLLWPLDADAALPGGLHVLVGEGEPPPGSAALRLPELAGAGREELSAEHAGRVQLLANAAAEGRVILLHRPAEHETAAALAELVREKVRAQRG